MHSDAEQGREIDWLKAYSRRTAGGVLVIGGGGSSSRRDGQGRPSVSAGDGDDLEPVNSNGSDSVMGSNLVSGQPEASSRMAAQERGSIAEGNRGRSRGCGAGASGCQTSWQRIALATAMSIVLAVLTPSKAMGPPSARHHDDWPSMLPESVSAESALGGEMLRHWMPRHALTLDNQDGVGQFGVWKRGPAELGGRKLLQAASVIREIPVYDSAEAKLITKNCAVDVIARINRACSVISETIPFYYVDEDTRTLQVNASRVTTTIRIVCWGSKDYSDPFSNIDANSYLQFSWGQGFKGMQTACGINPDNKIQCFGTDDVTGDTPDTLRQGQASPPDGKYTQVSVGGLHACALTLDDVAKDYAGGKSMICWGNNRMRQCSVPPIKQTSVVSTIDYVWIAAGYEHTCAFRTDNYLTCFGSNIDGQIKMPDANLATENQEDGFMSPASSYGCCNDCKKCDCNTQAYGGVGSRCREGAKISSGWYHTCVIRGGCDVQCAWTTSDCVSGQANNWYAPGTSCFCPSCVRPHEIECFGYGAWGNTISPPGKFKLVAASFDYTCGIYADCNGRDVLDEIVEGTGKSQCELANTVKCWGRNNEGQISVPPDLCDAANKALERAQAIVNDTIFETPAPPAKRLPCVCTPEKGCDCLGQYPRLEFENSGSIVSPYLVSAVIISVFTIAGSQTP